MRHFVPIVLLVAAAPINAQQAPAPAPADCSAPAPECVAVGRLNLSLALGAGARTNPIHGNSDLPLLVIPRISYYGRRFFLENLELGVHLLETRAHTLSLIATPGYDRAFFYRNDLQNIFFPVGGESIMPSSPTLRVPVRRPRTTYLAGPEWTFQHGKLKGQLDALYEVSGRHQGYEVRAALSHPLVESKAVLTANAGFTWKSAALVDYYYGLPQVYVPDAALNPFVKLNYSRPLSGRWSFNAFAHLEYLDGAIADSPKVADQTVSTVFVGFVAQVF